MIFFVYIILNLTIFCLDRFVEIYAVTLDNIREAFDTNRLHDRLQFGRLITAERRKCKTIERFGPDYKPPGLDRPSVHNTSDDGPPDSNISNNGPPSNKPYKALKPFGYNKSDYGAAGASSGVRGELLD